MPWSCRRINFHCRLDGCADIHAAHAASFRPEVEINGVTSNVYNSSTLG